MARAHDIPYLVGDLARMGFERIRAVMVHTQITGTPGDPCQCVVAEYLGVHTGRVVVAYPIAGITWFERVGASLEKVGTMPTPRSVSLFMNIFDKGLFPELIN